MSNELLKGSEKRILGGVFVVGAVVLTYMFVTKPMNEKRASLDAQAAEINRASESALAKIRGITTFYSFFQHYPKGSKVLVRCCVGQTLVFEV